MTALDGISCIHFVGVGGVGMSGLALVAHQRGFAVTGSDLKASRATRQLAREGVRVAIGHDASNVPEDCDLLVVSTAIPSSNPELACARARSIEVWHRSQMLAALGEGKKTLACAGTHGKTTTSSMLATMLDGMGLDPTFVIGGTVDGYGTGAADGGGEYFAVEADESDGSFVHLSPHIALVTNVEADHLDHYGTLDAIYAAFADFLSLIGPCGAAVVCADDDRLVQIARERACRAVTYGPAPKAPADSDATCAAAPDVTFEVTGRVGIGSAFSVAFPDGRSVDVELSRSPGLHNVADATGVLAVAWAAGLDVDAAARALSGFSGVRRRFDLVGEAGGVTVVDDYAHHPTEIRATIDAARGLDFERVHVLFQPHRYTRTQSLATAFGGAFDGADDVTLMDVYAAGEAPIPGVSGKTVVACILGHDPRAQVAWMPHRAEVARFLASRVRPGDLVITMGAGDVTSMGPLVLEALGTEPRN